VYHLAIAEKNLWELVENSLKNPATPEKRAEIKMTDEQIVKMSHDGGFKVKTNESLEPKNTKWKTVDEALGDFKEMRTEHIKYIKTTTEDLRNHVVQMRFGALDCYQVCLMIGSYSNCQIQQLNEMKTEKDFPAQ
jgi:hypothetical protein